MEIAKRRRREDRISKVGDGALGCILSFLPAKEAARAAALSSPWRHAFVAVHAISLEEPEDSIPDVQIRGPPSCCDYDGTPRFANVVTAALSARHRRPDVPPPPLRALRVVLADYRKEDASAVDHWFSYALSHAASPPAGLELNIRFNRKTTGGLRSEEKEDAPPSPSASVPVVSDESQTPEVPREQLLQEYTVHGRIFSCASLRSISIGPCKLSPPAVISLPSLEELLLIRVSDQEGDVQRLIAACPRLADLTLEACATVTELSLLDNRRLRRLALRCCHHLANVAFHDTLHSFEYRGAVPDTSLLTIHGGGARFVSCKVDICGEEEEFTKLCEFLQQLTSTKHLHLQSPRLGAGVDHDALARFPAFTHLVHLELTVRLRHEDDGVAAVSRILRHAPSLEVISLFFHTPPGHDDWAAQRRGDDNPISMEEEFLNAQQLRYNEHDEVLHGAHAVIIPCLRNRVREINLVHYHGGRAQRTLAKFLLCNALVLDNLYCGFAHGPLWIQTKLKDEMDGWAMNKPKNRIFS